MRCERQSHRHLEMHQSDHLLACTARGTLTVHVHLISRGCIAWPDRRVGRPFFRAPGLQIHSSQQFVCTVHNTQCTFGGSSVHSQSPSHQMDVLLWLASQSSARCLASHQALCWPGLSLRFKWDAAILEPRSFYVWPFFSAVTVVDISGVARP